MKTLLKLTAAFMLSASASAAMANATVYNMTLADVIDSNTNDTTIYAGTNPTAGPDGLGTDGLQGAFRFSSTINPDTYAATGWLTPTAPGKPRFYGDQNGGVIDMINGSAPCSVDGGATCFTSGFTFAGSPFQPYVNAALGGIAATINFGVDSVAGGGDDSLNFSKFAWAGLFGDTDNFQNLGPIDPADIIVDNLIFTGQVGADYQYAYRIRWNHVITLAEDPTNGSYEDQNTNWIIEGHILAAPVPEPETYAMMAAGLALVGFAARRRRQQLAV
jgi:hypothetical protein